MFVFFVGPTMFMHEDIARLMDIRIYLELDEQKELASRRYDRNQMRQKPSLRRDKEEFVEARRVADWAAHEKCAEATEQVILKMDALVLDAKMSEMELAKQSMRSIVREFKRRYPQCHVRADFETNHHPLVEFYPSKRAMLEDLAFRREMRVDSEDLDDADAQDSDTDSDVVQHPVWSPELGAPPENDGGEPDEELSGEDVEVGHRLGTGRGAAVAPTGGSARSAMCSICGQHDSSQGYDCCIDCWHAGGDSRKGSGRAPVERGRQAGRGEGHSMFKQFVGLVGHGFQTGLPNSPCR